MGGWMDHKADLIIKTWQGIYKPFCGGEKRTSTNSGNRIRLKQNFNHILKWDEYFHKPIQINKQTHMLSRMLQTYEARQPTVNLI
jgi:hypothetical protein